MLILDLWGISFHAVVVFSLGKNLLFKSVLGHCDKLSVINVHTLPNHKNRVFNFISVVSNCSVKYYCWQILTKQKFIFQIWISRPWICDFRLLESRAFDQKCLFGLRHGCLVRSEQTDAVLLLFYGSPRWRRDTAWKFFKFEPWKP